MLKGAPSGSVIFFYVVLAIFFIAGLLTLYPIEAEYCERAKDTKIEHCSKHHIALTTWYYVAFFSHEYHGILTAIATFTIALFTWFLRRSTDELRRSTDNLWEAGERQIAVAKTSADAAAKAADVAEKTLLATHRPKYASNMSYLVKNGNMARNLRRTRTSPRM